ncbi:YceI family protein [Streptomyces brasiliensis]|uniref:Polyisoprenoid-binding protein n=1 Tax=Streptomyces brasiliensis TaxID=1954 RepID=A0A917L1U4_9ACTN|nr:YceI family protein [Streptomyces brasiliensis]GGJ38640.1 polyisoprenoid-binding protein [Streptomyces brasiliensis]
MLRNRKNITVRTADPYKPPTGVYTVDPARSTIGFSVRHAVITNVRGKFTAFEGLLKLDGPRSARSAAYLSVQTGSLDTGMRDRDAQLTGPDLLDSATFPLMAFRSAAIVDSGEDQFRMSGYLQIKDVELPLHIDLEFGGATWDANGQHRVGFQGTTTLRRSDWGLDWNAPLETGSVLISDKVKLILDISAVQPARTGAVWPADAGRRTIPKGGMR